MRLEARDYESLRRDRETLDLMDKENRWTVSYDETGRVRISSDPAGKPFREAERDMLLLQTP